MSAVTLNEDPMHHHFRVLSVETIFENSCTSIPEYLNNFPSIMTFILDIFFLSGAVLGLLHILTRRCTCSCGNWFLWIVTSGPLNAILLSFFLMWREAKINKFLSLTEETGYEDLLGRGDSTETYTNRWAISFKHRSFEESNLLDRHIWVGRFEFWVREKNLIPERWILGYPAHNLKTKTCCWIVYLIAKVRQLRSVNIKSLSKYYRTDQNVCRPREWLFVASQI